MPKILITGNGFDLSFDLPTGYSDFINICNKLKNCTEFNWAFLKDEVKVLKNINGFPTSTFDNFSDFVYTLNSNIWFKYLSREFSIITWIDFEKHIEKALTLISLSLTEIKSETFLKTGRFPKSSMINYIENYDEKNYDSYLTLIDFKILLHQVDYHYLPILNSDFLKSIHDYYIDIDNSKIYSWILDDLSAFKELFQEYLSQIVLPLYEFLISDNKADLLKSIDYHFTFNYTPTFSKLISENIRTTFIHGDLKNKNIILGINSWNKVSEEDFNLIPFTKYFQKLNLNLELKFVDEIENEDKEYQYFFWGHSLDKSDAIYINEVFDRVESLDKISSTGKIIIIYHSESSKFSIIKNLIEIRGDKDIINKRRQNKLIFLHCDSEELKRELSSPIIKKDIEPDISFM
ncbi:AbiH family protein [Sphingobacterium sp. MYb382]|uniref:AbiH family protein n=1 Tax=Sphingobacterium sp. MYb382 TaxID=2745278 RepID=UPI0030A00557